FRGADVATFARLCQAIAGAGGDEETLAVSRRSVPGVLRLVNALFAQVMLPPLGGVLVEAASDATPAVLAGGPWPEWLVRWDEERDPLLPLRPEEGPPDAPTAALV